jgi:hypothetical protein
MGRRASVNVCLWHIADSSSGLAACPLLGVKRTFLTRLTNVR